MKIYYITDDEFIDKELVEDKRVYAYLNNNKE